MMGSKHLIDFQSKVRLVSASSMLIIFIFSISQLNAQFLKTQGTKIVDGNGDEVIWRGIGLGGWMLQEGYMLNTFGPQHQIEARIVNLVGQERKEEFYQAWLKNHVQKGDVDSLAAWGYNMIRLPMHYKLFTPPIEEEPVPGEITWREKGFEMTDQLLEWCKVNNIYLILDLHAAPGGQGKNADISDYDNTKPSLWESQANRAKTIALWRKLAERYANEPMIAAYDLINEPNWGFQNLNSDQNGCAEQLNSPLWQLQRDITNAIREVDQNHIIVIEGNCWGNNYNGLPVLWDNNLVISYHKYWNGNDQNAIQGMLNMRNNRNAPIWLGETGENSNTWYTDAIKLFESNKMGWAWWPLKKNGINNPLEITPGSGYASIINHWNNNGAKPNPENAYAALMTFAENLKLENNVYHQDVVDAKIRQPHTDETIPFKPHLIIPNQENVIHASDYDLGKVGFAYADKEYTNTTGNAGGQAWNLGYRYRNDGVDIEQTGDIAPQSNGYNVGWTNDGEWLLYSVQVDSGGMYDLKIRIAGISAYEAHLEVDGVDVTGAIQIPATGGYQIWQTVNMENVPLNAGSRKVKFFIDKGGFNFSYFSFFLKSSLNDADLIALSANTIQTGGVLVTFNKNIDATTLNGSSGFSLSINEVKNEATNVTVDSNNDFQLYLQTDKGIDDNDEIKAHYEGQNVLATDGSSLQPFAGLKVRNTLPVHFALPGKIEVESFHLNVGLELENTTDVGGGQNLGFTSTGDFTEYRVRVSETGQYKLEVRVACFNNSGKLAFRQFDQSGALLNESQVNVPVTGGWQSWQTVVSNMILNEGSGKLRMVILDPEFNINWFRLTFLGPVLSLNQPTQHALYPNPTTRFINLTPSFGTFSMNNALSITNIEGKRIYFKENLKENDYQSIDLSEIPAGVYIIQIRMDEKTEQHKLIIN